MGVPAVNIANLRPLSGGDAAAKHLGMEGKIQSCPERFDLQGSKRWWLVRLRRRGHYSKIPAAPEVPCSAP